MKIILFESNVCACFNFQYITKALFGTTKPVLSLIRHKIYGYILLIT